MLGKVISDFANENVKKLTFPSGFSKNCWHLSG